jgi:hypothetical protein
MAARAGLVALAFTLASACTDSTKVSREQATQHVELLARTAAEDVAEIRKGLPEGSKQLVGLFRARAKDTAAAPVASPGASASPAGSVGAAAADPPAVAAPAGAASVGASPAPTGAGNAPAGSAMSPTAAPAASASAAALASAAPAGSATGPAPEKAPQLWGPDPETAREGLKKARSKVQELRMAKSTFFALADANGSILRSDQEQDNLVGKRLFPAYAELSRALQGKYTEARGALPEAAGIRNRKDGQWVAAAPVLVDGSVRALYVTGWSWSAYAYRLQFKLRGEIEATRAQGQNPPLVYVLLVVGDEVFAWDAPEVDARAVADLKPWSALTGALANGEGVYTQVVTVEDTKFGLALKAVPALGPRVAIAVLRAET